MPDNPQPQDVASLDVEHLKTLYDFSLNMNSSLDFNTVLNNFMDSVMEITRAGRGFVMIDESGNGNFRVIVERGLDNDTLKKEGYSTTIVNQVVNSRESILTNNAQFDDRFQPGQSIIMQGLRAILCAPMIVQNRVIGAVYVDNALRSGAFTQSDLGLLTAVCGLAGTAIENARLYQVAVEKGRLERELQMARDIQRTLLPKTMPYVPGYEITARWQAAREVAGDFYDVFTLNDNSLGVVVADVSDKGAPAAMFMAVSRTMIRSHAHATNSPVETLARTNDLILEDADSGMFVTAFHSIFEPDGSGMHVNAGHNPPIIFRRATSEIMFMPRGGRAIGWFPNNPLEAVELKLEPGDMVIYYTDGLTEAESVTKDFFGEERLCNIILESYDKPLEVLGDEIIRAVDDFTAGAPPFDDLTLLIVRY
ncbi:MAG: GAF domain-containing SpoIIE family protein phosphatase, partial [Chloroflexota bacterium]